MFPEPVDPAQGLAGQFVPTSWTAIGLAVSDHSEAARAALGELCRKYWAPLHAYLRRAGYPDHDAKDLTQSFFVEIFRRNIFGAADRRKGKFRTFLLTAFQHFLADERRRTQADKRDVRRTSSLDETDEEGELLREPTAGETPFQAYERCWARAILQTAQERLRIDYEQAGKADLFTALREFLEGTDQGEYAGTAQRLGMTPNAVGVAVYRLRQRWADLVREEIAATLADPSSQAIEAERRHLCAALNPDA